MVIKRSCPSCKSKNISGGKNDYIYDMFRGIEVPIQFCNDCHDEWFVLDNNEVQNGNN